MIVKTFAILKTCLPATPVPKRKFVLKLSKFEMNLLVLKFIYHLVLNGVIEDHYKRLKYFQTIELN